MKTATALVFLLAGVAHGEETPEYPDHTDLSVYTSAVGSLKPITGIADWEIRRRHILEGFESAAGPIPNRAHLPPLDLRVEHTEARDGYLLQTVSLDDGAGGRITAFLYRPDKATKAQPVPGIIALHPTHPIGKGVVDGRGELPNRAYAKELAQRGYAVIAPDYPSFGGLKDHDFGTDGFKSGTMKGIANHMRCLDLLDSLVWVDADRIGAIGHSLGGHNALFLGLCDPRIKAVVTSCGWTPFHDYFGGKLDGWTSDCYMPLLRTQYHLDPNRVPFDFHELIAALAPRPFFTNSPLHDDNFDVGGVVKAMPKIATIYQLYGASENLEARYPNAAHDFPPEVREEAYRFLDSALRPGR